MPRPVPSRVIVVGGVIVLLGLTAAAVWRTAHPEPPPAVADPPPPPPDPPTPDPRVVFDTPFRNVKPGVAYVGDAACAACHPTVCKSYHAHPMGRSAERIAGSVPIETYDPAGHASFRAGAFELDADRTDKGVRHEVRVRVSTPAPVPAFSTTAEVAVGSGTRGRSYLSVESGAVWQTPVSWYGADRRWDVSPGFRLGTLVRRPITPSCLFCHVDRVTPVPGAQNRYREPVFPDQVAIGCERCHGPGALHAAERAAERPAGIDTSVVNPRHLSPALQAAVCEQCHLQGEQRITRRGRDAFEYRPGLPFEQFVSVFVRHPDVAVENRSVGQFEQMERSRCFTAARRPMVCTTCHDPHAVPDRAERDAHYRGKCLTCHAERGCALPAPERQAKGDSCIACHMPKAGSANIIHASVTDHRIPRTPARQAAPKGLAPGTPPLVRFRTGPHSPAREELERDLGLALAGFAKKLSSEAGISPGEVRALAALRLRDAVERRPGDGEGWTALAGLREDRDSGAEQLRAARNAVALAPESDAARAALVEAATAAGRHDEAEAAAAERIRLNPGATDPLLSRAVVRVGRGDWERAEADCRACLRLHPLHPQARVYLAVCLYKRGDRTAAEREHQTAVRLESDPREQAHLTQLFRRGTQ